MRRAFLSALLLAAAAACTPPAPRPASETVKAAGSESAPTVTRRIRVDGLVDLAEWVISDTLSVRLADGRDVTVLHRRGPDSLDLAFLGLGGNAPKPIHPEILLDVSGRFPAQFGRESWWFVVGSSLCYANGTPDENALECGSQVTGFEASEMPRERHEALEVTISFSLLGYNPTLQPEIAFALRFADSDGFLSASWPLPAQLARPETWQRLNLGG